MLFEFPNNAINTLPRILLGPIVRRITTNYVSIFLITKTGEMSFLHLFDRWGNRFQEDYDGTAPTQIGVNLYAHHIRISPTNQLEPGELYYYDIHFDDGLNLSDEGILNGGVGEYVYDSDRQPSSRRLQGQTFYHPIPSFVVPPQSVDALKIVHGSCRKLHGNFIDAIVNVDEIINTAIEQERFEERPHLFLHTGDQIYADDVSDVNLAIIRALDKSLITNWANPSTYETDAAILDLAGLPTNQAAQLNPGRRGDIITINAKFTVDKAFAQSHLIRFGEFVGMYLLAWSDVFWGQQFVPTNVSSVYPGINITTKEGKQSKKLFDNGIAQYSVGRANQKKVKKVLANISSLMILDDHEITDDVFISNKWIADTLGTTSNSGSALGKQIISNALTAYTLFQHIGNVEDDFSTFLASGFERHSLYNIMPSLVLPSVALSNIPDPKMELTNANSINYHFKYAIAEANWEIIGLNSRTNRSFLTDTNTISLLSDSSIELQIRDDYNPYLKVSIVMSPAPIWGFERVELIQLFSQLGFSPFTGKEHSVNKFDYESWAVNTNTREKLLNALFHRKYNYNEKLPNPSDHRVVVLCGDVHYGFAKKLSFVGGKEDPETYHHQLTVATLCASSMKNEDIKTKFTGRFKGDDDTVYYGIIDNGEPEPAFGGSLANTYKYVVEQIPRKDESSINDFLPAGTTLSDNDGNINNNSIKFHHLMHGKNDAILGFNHIGLVSFSNWNTNEPKVYQKSLWNRIEQDPEVSAPPNKTIIRSHSFTYEIDMSYKPATEIQL